MRVAYESSDAFAAFAAVPVLASAGPDQERHAQWQLGVNGGERLGELGADGGAAELQHRFVRERLKVGHGDRP